MKRAETCSCSYVINYTYLYHHIVLLDRYTHSNLVYYKHNGDDEPYDIIFDLYNYVTKACSRLNMSLDSV